MRKITTTALATAALSTALLAPVAQAEPFVFIAGTVPPGVGTHVGDGDYTWASGHQVTDEVYIVQYPRALYPLSGDRMLWQSVNAGANNARPHVENGTTILAISQGALVAEQIKQWAVRDGVTGLTVITYGDPINHDGGILTKIWGVPTAPILRPTEQPQGYEQITYAIEYEFVADAPDVGIWFNPFSWANSAMSGIIDHATYSQDLIDKAAAEGRLVKTVDEYGTHYLIKQKNLPLTRPLRWIGVPDPIVDVVDMVLKPIINLGYTGNRTVTLPPGPAPTHPAPVPDSVPGDPNPPKTPDTTGEVSGNTDTAVAKAPEPEAKPIVKPKVTLKERVTEAVERFKTGNKFSPGDTVVDKQERRDDDGTTVTDTATKTVQPDPEPAEDISTPADSGPSESPGEAA